MKYVYVVPCPHCTSDNEVKISLGNEIGEDTFGTSCTVCQMGFLLGVTLSVQVEAMRLPHQLLKQKA